MKNLIFLSVIFLIFKASYGQSPSVNKNQSGSSINISTCKTDTIIFTKRSLAKIVKAIPDFTSRKVWPPDECYARSRNIELGTPGTLDYVAFNCEVCADDFYALYAYFLKQRNGDYNYEAERRKLINIYRDINNISGVLHGWGTYFGHENTRILGRAEYAVYLYGHDKQFRTFEERKSISNQKQIYFRSIRQMINDELGKNNDLTEKQKLTQKKELLKTVNELERLIANYFYLKMAQRYQYLNSNSEI
ncbi:MAG: hypothetical protein ACTHJ8_07090 [Mucilaginibacter sp.]